MRLIRFEEKCGKLNVQLYLKYYLYIILINKYTVKVTNYFDVLAKIYFILVYRWEILITLHLSEHNHLILPYFT